MKPTKTNIKELRALFDQHNKYWGSLRTTLMKYKRTYEMNFWEAHSELKPAGATQFIETPYAYKFIEEYVSALFIRQPGIEVGKDPVTTNIPAKLQVLINRWLVKKQSAFEDTTRQGLIFTSAFLKLFVGPYDDKRPITKLEAIKIQPLSPWNVIVDRDALTWEDQRYCGCIYYLPLSEVLEIHGGEGYRPTFKEDFFDKDDKNSLGPTSDKYKYCQIIELWDFQSDQLIFWTPDHVGGDYLISSEKIPVRNDDDLPMANIIPLYLSSKPGKPMEGLSSMSRIYDQVCEYNVMRTMRANIVRNNVRKYAMDKNRATDEVLGELLSPNDSGIALTDGEPGNLLVPIMNAPLETDFNVYIEEILQDLERGTSLPPFSRGEATNATATEVGYLNNYASNEIGKMSRQKGICIERVAELYIAILKIILKDTDQIPAEVNNSGENITKKDLTGSYVYSSVDGNASPITLATRKQNLLQQAPFLIANGANKKAVLTEVIKMYDWPESFLSEDVINTNAEPINNEPSNSQPQNNGAY